jgi:hypothetical protein
VVVALFAALIAPWFINWNDYRATFEEEASRILGQPVKVTGTATASILPTPSLAFTDVRVGDTEGKPMMTVEKFEVTIELMPLLQGEIRVISMNLRKPVASISVDDAGTVDWLIRNETAGKLDPDKVVLENVQISDGRIAYSDARTGVAKVFDKINAAIEARSLSGPWRIDGSYLDEGQRVPVRVSTGRRAENGTIRTKIEFSPAGWAAAITADGDIGTDDAGLYYRGTYNLAEPVAAEGEGPPDQQASAGWRSEGAFTLTRGRLDIEKAILSEGPPDRPYSVAGSLIVDLGPVRRFEATIQARQLDLDRSLGSGPTAPVQPAEAAESLVAWLRTLYVPSIPGKLAFSVPGIIVGGAVIQDASFLAEPAADGWRISDLHASLPGQATLEAEGTLTTAEGVGFLGDVHLSVQQPTGFAAWWRGKGQEGAGRQLDPFDLSGNATVAPGRLAIDKLTARIGAATVRGRFAWTESGLKNRRRHLGTDLSADRIDYTQVRAIGELLLGKNIADAGALADSYAIKLATRSLVLDDLTLNDVAVDASYADDALTVNEFRVGDLGGARVNITRGRIDKPLESPEGRLEGRLEAPTDLAGFASVVEQLAPDTAIARWLTRAAPALTPAILNVAIEAPAKDGGPGLHVAVSGVAASTTLSAGIDLAGTLADWRGGKAAVSLTLDSPDADGLARQTGLTVPAAGVEGGSHLTFTAAGVPETGVAVELGGDFGGLALASAGNLILGAGKDPTYAGSLKLTTGDLIPLLQMAALAIPGAALGTPVAIDGTVEAVGPALSFAWQGGQIGDRIVGGKATVGWRNDGSLDLGGDLAIDEVDLGWLAALGLGFAIEPTGDRFSPWSKAPFGDPDYGAVHGRFAVKTDRFAIADGIDAANAALDFGIDPHRIDLGLKSGQLYGGTVAGGLTINNVGGNSNLTGRFELKNATLDSVVWQRDGRSVATGAMDLSANFESAGRSPAGIVSSLTGGGTLTLRDGEARYVNPKAASLIIRASDLGQEFSDDALRSQFLSYIEGASLPFSEASAPFSIAAGTLRIKNLEVQSAGIRATGGATIDLNTLDLESDWTLAFDAGDDKAKGTVPQAGLVFRGPLADPSRIVDVVQLGAYLNIRQEERIQEILSLEQADRAEKERLNRLKRKLREDAARRARDAEAAAAAESARREAATAATAKLDVFHAEREAYAARRLIAVAAASQAAAMAKDAGKLLEAASAARVEADAALAMATDRLASARGAVRDAAAELADANAAEAATAKAAARAEAERDEAQRAADAAEAAAQAAETASAGAELLVEEKAAEQATARAAAGNATTAKAAADREAADKAAALADAEKAAADAVDEDAAAAQAAADAAGKEAVASAIRDAAAQEADAAVKAEAAARAAADAARSRLAVARKAVADAETAVAEAKGPSTDSTGAISLVPDAIAVAAADASVAAAKSELADAERLARESEASLAGASAAARAAALAVSEASAAAEAALRDNAAADEAVKAKAAARDAAERAVADAGGWAENAAAAARTAARAADDAAEKADGADRALAAAREAEKSAGDRAAELAGLAERATDGLAAKAAAASEARAAAELAAARAAEAAKAADRAGRELEAAEAELGAAKARADAAEAAETAARTAADKASAAAAKSASGLSAISITRPASLTPVEPAPARAPALKPKRPPKPARDDRPMFLLPRLGQ